MPADVAGDGGHARTIVLYLPGRAPWTELVITGVTRLRTLDVPG